MPSSNQRASPLAENLVRDGRIRKGRQCRLLFQSAQKFKARYATLGINDKANLDDGHMWPVAFALKDLLPAEAARIGALVKKAVG